MKSTLILNAQLVNEGKTATADVLIRGRYIERIDKDLQAQPAHTIIDARGLFLLPGVIDDQVHFREPGLTHKGTIHTESRAAVAGGVTSFMEMPNTVPPALTQELLEEKYCIAARTSLANYSFYLGASNDNLDEVLKTDIRAVCGLKIFTGSSTGNLLVDDTSALEGLFARFPALIAAHCEEESIIAANLKQAKVCYGNHPPVDIHPRIRTAEACYQSSSKAVALAKKHNTRLHILHISTAKELELFDNTISLSDKRITAEACIHHLLFDDSDYERLGVEIKWNPAIKTKEDRDAIFNAVLNDRIDVIASDHAPHTIQEKQRGYFEAPSGGPLAQHTLVAMLGCHKEGKISLEKVVEKMCHNPATLFQIECRGFIREGYFADLALIDLHAPWTVAPQNIVSHCGWSPFLGHTFESRVVYTWVSGHLAYAEGQFNNSKAGVRLAFLR